MDTPWPLSPRNLLAWTQSGCALRTERGEGAGKGWGKSGGGKEERRGRGGERVVKRRRITDGHAEYIFMTTRVREQG